MTFDDLFVMSQYLAPQHLLSRTAGLIADCRNPALKNALIKRFISHFDVDMNEAEFGEAKDYEHFNDFFTRALKPDAREIDSRKDRLVSPVDGTVSQLGKIQQGQIFQAKGQSFNVIELLGGNAELGQSFMGGDFATIYLSPKDYHRIHMPLDGTLRDMIYVPGKLFSVNPVTTEKVPRLFARNERVVAIFDTEIGPVAMVLVGAMIVASIETVWAGLVAPLKRRVMHTRYGEAQSPVTIGKGEEMGRFKLGSTVVMLFPPDKIEFDPALKAGASVRMGQTAAKK